MSKKKILLVWWYDRQDLIQPFLEMKDELDITVLFYRFPTQENTSVSDTLPFRKIYWLDYLSPYSLLRDIQPEKIIFFGNESTLTISLIAAAKIKKITTVYVSHGLRSDLDEIIQSKNQPTSIERYQASNINYNRKKWHTFLFLFLTFSLKKPQSLKLIYEVITKELKFKNPFVKLKNIHSDLRKTDQYYLFAPENSLMMKELDQAKSENIFYTGPYTLDNIFLQLQQFRNSTIKKYWLLIDQPLAHLTFEKRLELYQRISRIANSNGYQLYVKLHPMDYHHELKELDNIKWIKTNTHISQLIQEASGILGYFSTMLLPIICYKKCILFDTGASSLVKKWESLNVVKCLNIDKFNDSDINFDSFIINENSRKDFIKQFVVHIDGQCTQRLKTLILQ